VLGCYQARSHRRGACWPHRGATRARAAPLERARLCPSTRVPAPRLSVPHALGGRRLAPSLVAPSWLGLARPALTLAAGWPRCVVVGLSHSAATPASAASSQRSVRGPGCPRFFSSPGGAHTSVRPCLAPPSLRVLSANYSPECAHLRIWGSLRSSNHS